MQRTQLPSFGIARMLIEDGLTEMAIQQAPWEREIKKSILKDQRFYDIPYDAIKITDILVKNHFNNKGQYRSIPRLLNEPKIKDIDKSHGDRNSYDGGYSDLNGVTSNVSETYTDDITTGVEPEQPNTVGTRAMEYGYFIKGNKIAIVEKSLYQDPSGDIINDTDAYQKSDYSWTSPTLNSMGGLVIRYSYSPTYKVNGLGENYHATAMTTTYYNVPRIVSPEHSPLHTSGFVAAGSQLAFYIASPNKGSLSEDSVASLIDVTNAQYSEYFTVGKLVWLDDAGRFTGLWEIQKRGGDGPNPNVIGVARPPHWEGGQASLLENGVEIGVDGFGLSQWGRIPVLATDVSSLYEHKEDYFLPVSSIQARALIAFIKGKMAEEAGDLKAKQYYDKEFKTKLAQQETAYMSGPRMVSPGPFALKR